MSTAEPLTLISSRYELVTILGEGGMGTVYRAKDRLTGEIVALKQMSFSAHGLEFASKTDSVDPALMLAQEFKILASLRHPNIVSVLDYGFDAQSQPFYTMTLLEEAQGFLAVGRERDLDGKITLVIEVLQALAYLHRRGILHRDLKPANIMIDTQQHVKVVDFGLAVVSDQNNTPAGTIHYMAPEVLRGHSAVAQSDLYAVGVLTYELLTGQKPRDAVNPISIIYKVLSEPLNLEPLSGISPALVAIIQRLLAVSIEDRYPTAEAVIRAFAETTGERFLLETQATRESYLQAARFVGREAELNQLSDALHLAAENKGSVWLVGGESGVGKSRLLDELQTQGLLRGGLVLRGQAVAEAGTPYQIWREAIRRLSLQTELTDFEATVLKPLVPDLDRLLNREVPNSPEVEAQSLQPRLLSVIESMFRQQHQLIVLLLEDLQWADESLILLKRLSDLATHAPLLIVGTYRNDERPTLPDELPMLRHIKLERLAPAAIEQLSVSMLGEVGSFPNVVDLLKRETEGNVFFIVEVVRALAEEAGQLTDVGRKTLPHSVFAGGINTVITRRLGLVPESARRLMTIAAVVGRELDLKLLHQIMPTQNMDTWLQQVSTVIDVQDNRFRFTHDKLREALLTGLEANSRKLIHAEIAQAIETVYPDSPDQYAALAYHWGQAQNAAKTVTNAILAGQQALHSGTYREAIRLFEQALALTSQVQLTKLELANLHYLLGDAHWGQSDMHTSHEWQVKALNILGYSIPKEKRQLATGVIRPLLSHIARRVFRIQRPAANPEELIIAAQAFFQITMGSYHDADFALGIYSIFNGIDAAERTRNRLEAMRILVRSYAALTNAAGDFSLHRIARVYARMAKYYLAKAGDPETIGWFNLIYSAYLSGQAEWDESNQRLEEGARLSKSVGNIRLWSECVEFQIYCFALQGHFAEALRAVESITEIAKRDRQVLAVGRVHVFRARLLFLQGQTQEGRNEYFDNLAAIEAAENVGDQTITRLAVTGVRTDFHLRAEEWDAALKSAQMVNDMVTNAQTVSFALGGEAAMPLAVYLTLWEKHGNTDSGKQYRAMAEATLKVYHRKYARHYALGEPIENTYRSWYFWLSGDEKQARSAGGAAVEAGHKYRMPYYEALACYHLARFMPKSDPERARLLNKAVALFEQVGAAYDVERTQTAL